MTPRDTDGLTELTRAELLELAQSRPTSGRGMQAKMAAITHLERRARPRRDSKTPRTDDVPDDIDLDEECGVGRFWHPDPGSDWEWIYACDTVRTRLRWRHALRAENEPFVR